MKISERADKFAQRFVKPRTQPDNRSVDEKLALFHQEYEPKALKDARKRVKSARGKNAPE